MTSADYRITSAGYRMASSDYRMASSDYRTSRLIHPGRLHPDTPEVSLRTPRRETSGHPGQKHEHDGLL
jgi:hypothetical protein